MIEDFSMKNVNSLSSYPFKIYRSTANLITNVSISDIDQVPMLFKNSQIETFDNLRVTNCSHPVTVDNSVVKVIANSAFES